MSSGYVEVGFSVDRIRATIPHAFTDHGPGFDAKSSPIQRRGASRTRKASLPGCQITLVEAAKHTARAELDFNLSKLLYGHNGWLLSSGQLRDGVVQVESELSRHFGIKLLLSNAKPTYLEVARDLRVDRPTDLKAALLRMHQSAVLTKSSSQAVSYRAQHGAYLRLGGQSSCFAVYDKQAELQSLHKGLLLSDRRLRSHLEGVFRIEARFKVGRCSKVVNSFKTVSAIIEGMAVLRAEHTQKTESTLQELFGDPLRESETLQFVDSLPGTQRALWFYFIEAVKAVGFDSAVEIFNLSSRDKRTYRRKLQELGFKSAVEIR